MSEFEICIKDGCDNPTKSKTGICMICEFDVRNMAKETPKKHIDIKEDTPAAPIKRKSIKAVKSVIPETEKSELPLQDDDALFNISKHKSIILDPEMAERYLNLNTYSAQRKFKKRNLEDLIRDIEDGLWRSAEISFAVFPDGSSVLVNGQHTLRACVSTGTPIFVFMVWYEVKGPAGLSALYRTFDLGRGARSIGDAVKAEMAATGLKWPLRQATLISTAAACIESISFRHNLGKARQAGLISKYQDEGEWFISIVGLRIKKGKHLMRGSVATAMLKTWQLDKNIADRFWLMVRDGAPAPFRITHPANVLRNYLTEHAESWDRKILYSKCIEAFNAYVQKKDINMLTYKIEDEIPVPELKEA